MSSPTTPAPKLPGTTDALVEALDALFPARCPSPDQTDRDIWMYAGKRQLVEYIALQHQRHKNADLYI